MPSHSFTTGVESSSMSCCWRAITSSRAFWKTSVVYRPNWSISSLSRQVSSASAPASLEVLAQYRVQRLLHRKHESAQSAVARIPVACVDATSREAVPVRTSTRSESASSLPPCNPAAKASRNATCVVGASRHLASGRRDAWQTDISFIQLARISVLLLLQNLGNASTSKPLFATALQPRTCHGTFRICYRQTLLGMESVRRDSASNRGRRPLLYGLHTRE